MRKAIRTPDTVIAPIFCHLGAGLYQNEISLPHKCWAFFFTFTPNFFLFTTLFVSYCDSHLQQFCVLLSRQFAIYAAVCDLRSGLQFTQRFATTNLPCPVCLASWSRFGMRNRPWRSWKRPCHFSRTRTSISEPSCAWTRRPSGQSLQTWKFI